MISYKIGLECIEWSQLFSLYEKVGMLKRFIESKEFNKIQSAFQVSYKVVTAWEENTLVGSCRMLSDGICYGAVFDVAVLPECQKKGIGKGLMRLLLNGEEHMTIHLTSTFGNEGFYKKLGFKKHKTAYSKYPFESKYVED
ncbi:MULTISPECIES: GNAT family N-acetyltransferase [Clostridium]|uniref:GNAT family N-acetyltransferase n=1 Tax=Clostridium frigoriphilum TaxID=443253 RepID=A0ABU7UKP2_9CLOT|nr:GNAT family N-acetyltransferase [Clostridium sp. DSM 17811]MBU3098546.1 GNAT family N-acetyltransferase [Clostridium sp. DSM 17811]